MSASSSRKVVEWELLPAIQGAERAPVEIEIEEVEAEEEPMPQPGVRKEVVIVVDPGKLAKAAGAASVPVGGVVAAVVYFETIVMVIKIIVLGIGCLAGFVAAVFVLGNLFRSMAMSRQARQDKHPGWSETRQGGKTINVVQNAETIINHFH